jgi:hypothetical protein
LDPVVGGFFLAGGTETGFAGMRGFDLATTGGADKDMPAEKGRSTDEQFKHIDNNRFADEVPMGQKESPPVAVVEEEVSEFDRIADEFHNGRLYDLNVEPLAKLEKKGLFHVPGGQRISDLLGFSHHSQNTFARGSVV